MRAARLLGQVIDGVSLDATGVNVHPDGMGVLKKGRQGIGKSRGGWTTKKPLMVTSTEEPIIFRLSAGNGDDATEGRWVLESIGAIERSAALLMDQAYADSKTRRPARFLNFRPVVPPKKERTEPWRFDQEDKEVYKQRNGIERAFRRIFTRYDKRAVMFSAFVYLALICIISFSVNRP